jgi:predicted component of type VI protein secretion system
MKLSLSVLTAGKWQGKTIPVTRSPFVIGRDPACHLRPGSPLISNRHCALVVRAGKVFLRDFESTNGTLLDGQPVTGEVVVSNDQQLQVGPITLRISITPTVAVNQPTPLPPTKAAGVANEDEAAAALLLSLQDENGPACAESKLDPTGVPTGTTILIPSDAMRSEGSTAPAAGGARKPAKAPSGDTSASAKAILEKYLRRSDRTRSVS